MYRTPYRNWDKGALKECMMELVVVHTRSKESNDYSPYKEKKKSHSVSLYTSSISSSPPFFF